MLGLIEIAPLRCGPAPGRQVKSGSSPSARFTLADAPRNLKRRMPSTKSSGRCSSPTSPRNVRRGSAFDTTSPARISSPLSSTTPVARPFATSTRTNGRARADLRAGRARGARNRAAHRTVAALCESPGAKHPVDLAHVVVQQHVRGPGRARSEQGADDAARGLGRLERLGLEPFVEVVGRAHRHQLRQRVEMARPEAAEMRGEPRRDRRDRAAAAKRDRAAPSPVSASPRAPSGA